PEASLFDYGSDAFGSAMSCTGPPRPPLTRTMRSATDSRMHAPTAPESAASLFRQGSFVCFLASRNLSRFCSLIGTVAIGWQLYDITDSALALGMVDLVGFLPAALLVFVAGQAADRYRRQRIMQVCQFLEALTTLFLALGAWSGWLT